MINRHCRVLSLVNTINFILKHPLNKKRKAKAILYYFKWQIGGRLVPGPVIFPLVNNSRLIARPGMVSATLSIYTGLHEFEDMSFMLHLLREDDAFLDVGANIGIYSVLASNVVGANSFAIEPIPETFIYLLDNLAINKITEKVTALNIGAGDCDGIISFTKDLGTSNHVVTVEEKNVEKINVHVKRLDDVINDNPVLIKIDVEGYEAKVIEGSKRLLETDSLLAVIMELNYTAHRYGFENSSLHDKMQAFGFKPYQYQPLSRDLIPCDFDDRSATESFNTLYIRNYEKVIELLKTAPKFKVNGKEI